MFCPSLVVTRAREFAALGSRDSKRCARLADLRLDRLRADLLGEVYLSGGIVVKSDKSTYN
jgi:hypothetical protein